MTDEDPTSTPSAQQETTYKVTGPHPTDEPYSITAVKREDWKPGQSCPECGATHLHETHLNTECAVHQKDSSAFKGALDRLGTVEYWCPECESTLYRHAAYALWIALTNQHSHPIHS